VDKELRPPLDKATEAHLDDQIKEFRQGIWNPIVDHFKSEFEKKRKLTVPFGDPNSCGFEVFDKGHSIFKITIGFNKYWPNDKCDYWHVRLSINTEVPETRIGGYENRYLNNELPAISERAIIDFVKNLHPISMILRS